MNKHTRLSLFFVSGLLWSASSLNAQQDALIDANFTPEHAAQEWPAGWPRPAGVTWEEEGGNHFLRIRSREPGELVMLYREINIPAGTQELELSWRQRVTGLVRGMESWYDARIMMEFMTRDRQKVEQGIRPAARNRDTDGWEERSVRFAVPPEAGILKFMPSLFRVQAGTFDIDDIVLRPVTPSSP